MYSLMYGQIIESFTIFLKDFILKQYEIEWYKYFCSGERCGPWSSCFQIYKTQGQKLDLIAYSSLMIYAVM